MTVPWKIHGPHAWMQSSKPSFMAIWLAGQFVTRCPQPCPFQCSFLCPCLRICVCVFLQLSEVEDARGGYHTITHALLFVFPITACLQFRQVLEPFLSHEWLLGPWWCVWMAAWSAGHAIVWFQKVAARPALLVAAFFFSSHPYTCLGFIQNRPPASFSEFSPILRTSPWVTCSFHAIVKHNRLVILVVHGWFF